MSENEEEPLGDVLHGEANEAETIDVTLDEAAEEYEYEAALAAELNELFERAIEAEMPPWQFAVVAHDYAEELKFNVVEADVLARQNDEG